ncbi:tetratricopeptide repeat protein [Micromonospora tulbaghiae]
MTDRLVIDIGTDGRATIATWLDGELLPEPDGEPFPLIWPVDDDALSDLRWYLEDYLRAPYGVYGERGAAIAAALPEHGIAIFDALFGSGPSRDAYVRLRARGQPLEIVFRSSTPQWLALPWELLRDPARPSPVAVDGLAVTRSLLNAGAAASFAVRGERLRVLMVISRPSGTEDVGYRMVARPLLERLDTVRGEVDLVVLRPPTLDRLRQVLAEARTAGTPFQIVHFDGHGMLAEQRGDHEPVTYDEPDPQGVLVFEKPTGGPDDVLAATVGRVLADAQVPVVALNACQSGAVGKRLEAAVATRLMQEGVASVVAMAYTVYAVAAAEFMAAFYERLFAGERIADAVSAGRRRLAERNERPSPKGPMPLADWSVPVHYARRDVRFPWLRPKRTGRVSLDDLLDLSRSGDEEQPSTDPLAPVEAFVGRDRLFYTLEVASRLQAVVLLQGPGGTGKTELAKAYGRWWRDTGGVEHPDWVVWHSFEPGLASFGLDGVLAGIGLRVFGAAFARLDADERQRAVEQLVTTHRLLLIWDNFESVHTMPDSTGAAPPLSAEELEELRTFLNVVARGDSALVITSRTEEAWLGATVRRVPVSGLNAAESVVYADQLLAPYPSARLRRARPAFADLLEWLDGHPLSMRLILPHLDTTEPEDLLAGLRGVGALHVADGDGRTTSLTASIRYSYDHLGPEARRLLVAASLFHGVVDAAMLSTMSESPDAPPRFSGTTLDDWCQVLEEAAAVGLLSHLDGGIFQLQPALAAFLAARWRAEEPNTCDSQRASTQHALLDAYAALGEWLAWRIPSGDATYAFALIDHHRRNLGVALAHALDNRLWKQAEAIMKPLILYWDSRGMREESRGWLDRGNVALDAADGNGDAGAHETTDAAPAALGTPAGRLRLTLMRAEAANDANDHRLDAADRSCQRLHEILTDQPESAERSAWLASVYHQLGIVAQRRGRLDEAQYWYCQAQDTGTRLTDRWGLAESHHQLGLIAYKRGDIEEAERLHRTSLALEEERKNLPGMAASYHELGKVSARRGRLDEAEDRYRQAISISEQLGQQQGAAMTYHQLGTLAQQRGRLPEAEDWIKRSLIINESLEYHPGIALNYHELGNVAYQKGRLDEAERWYSRSLATKTQLDDRPAMATTLAQLGLLAERRGDQTVALEWLIKSTSVLEHPGHSAPSLALRHIARLTNLLGVAALERCWRDVTGSALPTAVRRLVAKEAQE